MFGIRQLQDLKLKTVNIYTLTDGEVLRVVDDNETHV